MLKEPAPKSLIEKYLRGESTPEETDLLDEWYNSFENKPDPMDTLSEVERHELKERMLTRIKLNLPADADVRHTIGNRSSVVKTLIWYLGSAAAILLLIYSISFLQKENVPENVTAEVVTANSSVRNLTSSLQKIILPDNSIVWLSPKSNVNFPKKFKGDFREVSMEGEAFFEITKDPDRPFIIHSGEVVTRVLGTSFRIKSFPQSSLTEVSVVTGKVSVKIEEENDSEVIIMPSQKAIYKKGSRLLEMGREGRASTMRIWEKITMSFENVPVSEVIVKLNSQFGVQISAEDREVNNYMLSADFTDQSLPAILEMLEKSLDIVYQINGQKISLNKKLKPISN